MLLKTDVLNLNLPVFTLAHTIDMAETAVVVCGFFLNQTNMNILFWEIPL